MSNVSETLKTSGLNPVGIYAAFLSHETRREEGRIPCERTPLYLFSVNEILSAYPNARVINMILDPRDVVMSQSLKWRRRFLGAKNIRILVAIRAWCNYHPYIASGMWISSIDYAKSTENERFISVYFEELVSRPDDELTTICGFLGLPFERKMLDVNQVGSSLGRDNLSEKGINKGRASGWRKNGMPSSTRLISEWICVSRMRMHNYTDLLKEGQFSLRLVPSMVLLPLKILLLIPFNLKRFPHCPSAIKRRLFVIRTTAS